ncbi:MAG: PhoH family protein [Pseudomonadales bacterium]|nr:PhoH family protein [Pseudomonadales bacterium]
MTTENHSHRLVLEPENPQRLANLCGHLNEHLRQIEQRLEVSIQNRSNVFMLSGQPQAVQDVSALLRRLYAMTASESAINPDMIHLSIQENGDPQWLQSQLDEAADPAGTDSIHLIRTPKCSIKPRGRHQNDYVHAVFRHTINFGIGPAGTGKTYLAVACAVEALMKDEVGRILLVRPAVEAGEKLGFLPGDLSQKVDPYLRPLYDALYEMLGFEKVAKLIERNVIEIAPLAYMRGRTLNNSFIILDESQNTTTSQMKMFLTRIGFGSTAVITGDVTQIDLPKGTRSGLVQASNILKQVPGVSFTYFNAKDVVRHPIVQKIVEAYDEHDRSTIAPIAGQDKDRSHERDS